MVFIRAIGAARPHLFRLAVTEPTGPAGVSKRGLAHFLSWSNDNRTENPYRLRHHPHHGEHGNLSHRPVQARAGAAT